MLVLIDKQAKQTLKIDCDICPLGPDTNQNKKSGFKTAGAAPKTLYTIRRRRKKNGQ